MLVSIIKDKAGKINSRDNYRPIALSSTISKILEYTGEVGAVCSDL